MQPIISSYPLLLFILSPGDIDRNTASLISVEMGAIIEIVKSGGSEQTTILMAKNTMYTI